MMKTENGFAKIYKIYGKSEAEVRRALGELADGKDSVAVRLIMNDREIHVLAEIAEQDETLAKEQLKAFHKEIKRALGTMYYSTKENETLEEAVVRLLNKYELTVTTAESCTGGMIASKIVEEYKKSQG